VRYNAARHAELDACTPATRPCCEERHSASGAVCLFTAGTGCCADPRCLLAPLPVEVRDGSSVQKVCSRTPPRKSPPPCGRWGAANQVAPSGGTVFPQAPPLRTLQDKTKQVTRVQTADGGFTVTYDQPLTLCVFPFPHTRSLAVVQVVNPEVGTQAYAPAVASVMRFSCGPGLREWA
jgi:hypothetical protein